MPDSVMLNDEGIKAIPGYPGYAVSIEGQVYSFLIPGSSRRIGAIGRPMRHSIGFGGYERVYLIGPARDGKRHQVHSLVLLAFIGPRPDGMECRHLNGNKRDNRLANLCWGTRQENADDKVLHGTGNDGCRNGSAKLTDKAVIEMRRLRQSGASYVELAHRFHVRPPTARAACMGLSWKFVNEPEVA